MSSKTLCDLFQARARLTPSREAYRQFEAATQTWVSYSWADMEARVLRWRAALTSQALPSGARIGVLVPNSVEHVCMDQAALASGFVPVPLHVIDNPESLAYVIADSGASLLLVESLERWRGLAPFQSRFPNLQRVVYLPGTDNVAASGIALSIDEWLARAGRPSGEIDRSTPIAPDVLAAIVYTSGTTGRPKGVMLSHRNIVSNVNSIMAAMPVHEDDVFLSFLPLSHTLERTVGYYLPIAAGASVAFARSIPLLMQDLAAIKPTVLVSVPRIYERAYAALREAVDRRLMTKFLFAWAVRVGWRQFEHSQGRASRPSLPARVISPLLDRLVAAPVRARFGGRLRAAVTGGAAMAPEVARPFLALGVPLLQGYGMTESAPVIACNTPEDNDPTSVGRALRGVAVRIGDRDELLAQGDNIMVGYWQRPEDTALARDPDGWLHTGDQAQLEGGRIRIKGRLKDIIVTSTGEKIAPADLEAAIVSDPLFEQAMVLGERRPYLAALVILNPTRWAQQARDLGLNPQADADLRSVIATRWALERIRQALRTFPSYATPRAVLLSNEPWTLVAGLITPTLKPKRAAIEARYAAEIAALYRGH
jgi:long-chain acyl-CoA synthetase